MLTVYPDYYAAFSCLMGACRHSCCKGWEIDVDEVSLARYKATDGDLGRRLSDAISYDGDPHFILAEDERCPFLNEEGLCEMILARGEEMLCDICREHPRFHNALPGRLESGLGATCEAAARLILGRKEPLSLVGAVSPSGDEIIDLRDEILLVVTDRSRSLSERVSEMLSLAGATVARRSNAEWADLLLSLERLDGAWTEYLERLREIPGELYGFHSSEEHEIEYEQILSYFVYRYLASSECDLDVAENAALAAFSLGLLLLVAEDAELDFDGRVELFRLYSSEIEYSEENLAELKAALLSERDDTESELRIKNTKEIKT